MSKRADERLAIAMPANCRQRDERRVVLLTDISRSGCRITSPKLSLHVGQRVILRPQGLETLFGTVKWWMQDYGGLQFDQPLHAAVVRHLCKQHPADSGTVLLDLAG